MLSCMANQTTLRILQQVVATRDRGAGLLPMVPAWAAPLGKEEKMD